MSTLKNGLKVLALSSLISGMYACSDSKTAEEYILSAQQLHQANKNNAAILELKNAISLNAENGNARLLLGKIYLAQGDYASAAKELTKAVENAEVIEEAAPLLAKAFQYEADITGLELLHNQVGGLSNDTKAAIYGHTSIFYSQIDNIQSAQEFLDLTKKIDSATDYPLLAQAWLYSKSVNLNDALSTVNSIPESSDLYNETFLLKGHIYNALGQHKEAAESYQQFVKGQPKNYQISLYLANSLIADGQYEAGEKVVDELIKLFPKHGLLNQLKAQVYYAAGDYVNAKEFANKALTASDLIIARLIQGLSSFQLKEYELAHESLNGVVDKLPVNHPVQKIYASLLVKLGYSDAAADTFTNIDDYEDQDVDLLKAASFSLANSGKNEAALNLVDKGLLANPKDANLLLHKGMLQLKENNSSGYKFLEEAITYDPTLKYANLAVAMKLLSEGKKEQAFKIADNWKNTEGELVNGLMLEGVLFNSIEDYQSALNAFNQILDIEENNHTAHYYKALCLIALKDFEQAKVSIYNALATKPNYVGALNKLIQLGLSKKIPDQTSYLKQLQKDHSNFVEPLTSYATYLKLNGKTDEALKLMLDNEKTFADQQAYQLTLATLYQTVKNYDKAVVSYQKAIKKDGTNLSLIAQYILMLMDYNQNNLAMSELDRFSELNSYKPELEMLKAAVYLEQGKVDNAKSIVQTLKKQKTQNLYLTNLEAELALLDKDYVKAENLFKVAIQEIKLPKTIFSYAMALNGNHKTSEAIVLLEQYLAKYAEVPALRALLSEYQIKVNPQAAINNYLVLLEQNPNDLRVLNNLASLYVMQKDKVNALKYGQKANQLAPKNIYIMDTYASALLLNNKLSEAKELLTQAYSQQKNNIDIALNYVDVLLSSGDKPMAKEVLQNIEQNKLTEQQKTKFTKLSSAL